MAVTLPSNQEIRFGSCSGSDLLGYLRQVTSLFGASELFIDFSI